MRTPLLVADIKRVKQKNYPFQPQLLKKGYNTNLLDSLNCFKRRFMLLSQVASVWNFLENNRIDKVIE